MKHISAFVTFLLLSAAASLPLAAQEVKQAEIPDAEKPIRVQFQADAVAFGDTVSLTMLKIQKMARAVINRDTGASRRAGYVIESYTCTYISYGGPRRMRVTGSSLLPALHMFSAAKAGESILFSDIRVRTPESKVIYLENASAVLID